MSVVIALKVDLFEAGKIPEFTGFTTIFSISSSEYGFRRLFVNELRWKGKIFEILKKHGNTIAFLRISGLNGILLVESK